MQLNLDFKLTAPEFLHNPARLARLKIIFIFLLIAVGLGYMLGASYIKYSLMAIGAVAFIWISLYNLRYGLAFWILTGGIFLIPIYKVRHAAVYPSIVMLTFLFILWGIQALNRGTLGLPQTTLKLPLLALAGASVISMFQGMFLYDANVPGTHRFILVQIFSTIIILYSIFASFLVARYIKTIKHLKFLYLLILFLTAEILLIVYGKIPLRLGWYSLIFTHALGLVYADLLFNKRPALLKRILFGAFVLFLGLGVLNQFLHPARGQWISGWMATGVPLIFITFFKSRKVSLMLILLFIAILLATQMPRIDAMFKKAGGERDYDRFGIWVASTEIWLKRPLFGTGPGNYMDYALTYAAPRFAYTSSHDDYFQILAELGIFAFIFFIWIMVRAFKLGLNIYHKAQNQFIKIFALGVMGSLAGQLTASFFGDYILPAYHNGGHRNISTTIYTWVMIGGLMAAEQIVNSNHGVYKNLEKI